MPRVRSQNSSTSVDLNCNIEQGGRVPQLSGRLLQLLVRDGLVERCEVEEECLH